MKQSPLFEAAESRSDNSASTAQRGYPDALVISERVAPDDGRNETRWFCLALVVILSCSALVLQFNQRPVAEQPQYLTLSAQAKSLLTALRNAGDEMLFMLPAEGQLGELLPSVDELVADGIPPFAASTGASGLALYQWRQLPGGCYVGAPADTASTVQHPAVGELAELTGQTPLLPSFMLQLEHTQAGRQVSVYWGMIDNPALTDCNAVAPWQAYLE